MMPQRAMALHTLTFRSQRDAWTSNEIQKIVIMSSALTQNASTISQSSNPHLIHTARNKKEKLCCDFSNYSQFVLFLMCSLNLDAKPRDIMGLESIQQDFTNSS